MPEAIRSLLQSKRALIALMTAIFDAVLVIVLAVGYGIDPEQAREVWTPLIAALATIVSALATVIIAAYTKRDPIPKLPSSEMSQHASSVVSGFVVVLLAVGLSGCAMGSLRTQAEDHYVQTRTIADACRDQSRGLAYPEAPCSADLQADLDAMAKQAECVLAVTKGDPCRID